MNENTQNAAERAAKNAETAKAVEAHIKDVTDKINAMSIEELKNETVYLCKLYNEADEDDNAKAMKALDTAVQDFQKALNKACREACFVELKATSDPILEACRRLTYVGYKVKDTKLDKDSKDKKRVVEEVDRDIDILKLREYLGKVSGKDSNWPYMIEALNLRMTIRVIEELTASDPDGKTAAEKIKARKDEIIASYRMSEVARQLKDNASVSNNTQLAKAMQNCINAMVGEVGKVRTHDVRYLVQVYTKAGRVPGSVRCSNHKTLAKFIMHVIHAMITKNDEFYTVEYDKAKKKGN